MLLLRTFLKKPAGCETCRLRVRSAPMAWQEHLSLSRTPSLGYYKEISVARPVAGLANRALQQDRRRWPAPPQKMCCYNPRNAHMPLPGD